MDIYIYIYIYNSVYNVLIGIIYFTLKTQNLNVVNNFVVWMGFLHCAVDSRLSDPDQGVGSHFPRRSYMSHAKTKQSTSLTYWLFELAALIPIHTIILVFYLLISNLLFNYCSLHFNSTY